MAAAQRRDRAHRGARRAHAVARLTLVLALLAAPPAAADRYVDALATDDPRALAAAVEAIERAATTPELAEALFAAGRASEDRLLDPARALALYERIVRELPDARVATAAGRRADRLRTEVGSAGEHAREASELARLIATADQLALPEVVRRADALAQARWPGAPEAARFVAELLRRRGRHAEADARYAEFGRRWPGTPHAVEALRGGAGNALEAGAWDRAEQLARQLPTTDEAERILRDDLLDAAHGGRVRARVYVAAWIALLAALAGLLGSLADAIVRGGRRAPSARPPIEVLYLAPGAAILVGVAFTGNVNVAPAVAVISIGGLGLAWISGATLDLLRARGRAVRLRAIAHVLACIIGAVSLGYIAMVRGGLLDMLIETVTFGPGA